MATDLLMMFVKDGTPIPAESQSTIDPQDKIMMRGFVTGKYFEIKDFDFGISLTDNDSSGSEVVIPPQTTTNSKPPPPKPKETKKSGGKFSKFMQGDSPTGSDGKSIYPPSFDEVQVNRQMDKASPVLFQNCFKTKSFDSAVIVKRKSSSDTTTTGYFAFFRIDFNDVLITDISWSIGEDVIMEKLKFVCREVAVQYIPQNNDGSAGDKVGGQFLSLVKRN